MKFNKRQILLLPLMIGLIFLSACEVQENEMAGTTSPNPSLTPTERPTAMPTAEQAAETAEPPGSFLPGILDVIVTRTPVPTATPGALNEIIEEVVQETGLSNRTFFYLPYSDWINLGVSVAIILIGYLIGTWSIRWLFPRLVRRTKTVLDDQLLETSGNIVRWLVVIIILRFSTIRLTFLSSEAKVTFTDIYFFLTLSLIVFLLFRLINLATAEAKERAEKAGLNRQTTPIVQLSSWFLRVIVIVIGVSLIMTRFGANITGLSVILVLMVLVIYLFGRDILADFVAAAIILLDQPYNVGDRVDILELDAWGDVIEIGARSTKIRLIDNRTVIFPNSEIAKSKIINYSYQDSAFFDENFIMVAYDNDVEAVGRLLLDTIRSVEGVMTDREIGIWLMSVHEYSMVFTTSWWISSYRQKFDVRNRVNRAIMQALREAGIKMPQVSGVVHVNSPLPHRLELKENRTEDSSGRNE